MLAAITFSFETDMDSTTDDEVCDTEAVVLLTTVWRMCWKWLQSWSC